MNEIKQKTKVSKEIYVDIGSKSVHLYVSEAIRQIYKNLGKMVILRAMGSEAVANAIHTVYILKSEQIIQPDIKIDVAMERNFGGYKMPTIMLHVKSMIGSD